MFACIIRLLLFQVWHQSSPCLTPEHLPKTLDRVGLVLGSPSRVQTQGPTSNPTKPTLLRLPMYRRHPSERIQHTMMRTLITSVVLICTLLLNGVTLIARNSIPKGQKSRIERKTTSKAPTKKPQASRTAKREAAKELQLIKKNPRLASLFKDDSDHDVEREDQPQEALEWYLKKRLPKGERQLPIERYFQAKEKIKQMKRFSTRKNKDMSAPDNSSDADPVLPGDDGEFPN